MPLASKTHDVSAAVNISHISDDGERKRTHLILEHMRQVKIIARRIHKSLPASANLDDLISAGVIGLIAAVDSYDSKRDVKLKTYAEYRVRGAILDSLRNLDWAPRGERRRSKLIEKTIGALEQELQRTPAEEEISDSLNISVSTYREWLAEASSLTLGSLENAGTDDRGGDLLRYLPDSEQSWPSKILERTELERCLAQAIHRMPGIERTVLSLYYYEDITLREIAKVVNLHESRISQLKSQAILRLRAYMQYHTSSSRGQHNYSSQSHRR